MKGHSTEKPRTNETGGLNVVGALTQEALAFKTAALRPSRRATHHTRYASNDLPGVPRDLPANLQIQWSRSLNKVDMRVDKKPIYNDDQPSMLYHGGQAVATEGGLLSDLI